MSENNTQIATNTQWVTSPVVAAKPKVSAQLVQKYGENDQISRAIVSAPSIRQMELNDFAREATEAYRRFVLDYGFRISPDDDAYYKARFLGILTENYKHLSIEEVKITFNRAVMGEYGELYGLNVKTLHKVLKEADKAHKQAVGKAMNKEEMHKVNNLKQRNETLARMAKEAGIDLSKMLTIE